MEPKFLTSIYNGEKRCDYSSCGNSVVLRYEYCMAVSHANGWQITPLNSSAGKTLRKAKLINSTS